MTDQQVQHLINMLAGIQTCLKLIGWMILFHLLFGGTSMGGVKDQLKSIADALKARRL